MRCKEGKKESSREMVPEKEACSASATDERGKGRGRGEFKRENFGSKEDGFSIFNYYYYYFFFKLI